MQNSTYFKYSITQSKVCRFDFLRAKVLAFHIDHNRLIQINQDNI